MQTLEAPTQAQEHHLLHQATGGSRDALEQLIDLVRDRIYGLALRMLHQAEDAEDATQEILIRVITHLAQFRGESRFTTWVYRVAANYLLRERKRTFIESQIDFEGFARDFEANSVYAGPPRYPEQEADLLEEENRISCSTAMLMCLDRGHRIAFILGRILELPNREAAAVLAVQESTYRKRLSRAHHRLSAFMDNHCGLVNPDNPCRCRLRIEPAVRAGYLNPDKLYFAVNKGPRNPAYRHVKQIGRLKRAVEVYRGHPHYTAPDGMVQFVRELLETKPFRMDV